MYCVGYYHFDPNTSPNNEGKQNNSRALFDKSANLSQRDGWHMKRTLKNNKAWSEMFNLRLWNSLEYNLFPVNIHPDYRPDPDGFGVVMQHIQRAWNSINSVKQWKTVESGSGAGRCCEEGSVALFVFVCPVSHLCFTSRQYILPQKNTLGCIPSNNSITHSSSVILTFTNTHTLSSNSLFLHAIWWNLILMCN